MFNKIGKFFGDVSCGIGLHKFGDWQYQVDNSCSQTRSCSRCEKSEARIWHSWDNWIYIAEHSCDQERPCLRCGAKDHREAQHQWSEWAYIQPDSCAQTRTCSRCKENESRTAPHVWGGWRYSTPDSCEQTRLCQRCGIAEVKKPVSPADHEKWSDWKYASANSCQSFERICLRCGLNETKEENNPIHDWGKWEQSSSSMQRRVCRRCNHIETQALQEAPHIVMPDSSAGPNLHAGAHSITEEANPDALYMEQEELDYLKEKLETSKRMLAMLEIIRAKKGSAVEASTLLEIENTEKNIKEDENKIRRVIVVPHTGTELKKLRITGRVTYANGNPLAGAIVEAEGSGKSGNNLYFSDSSNANGIYTLEVAPGRYAVRATKHADLNGRGWTIPLQSNDNNLAQVDPTSGATKDFTWRLQGTQTGGDPSDAQDHYGAFIVITVQYRTYQVIDGFNSAQLEFQLVPIGKLIDGSNGQTITFRRTGKEIWTRHGLNDPDVWLNTRYLPDIPIGLYRLTVQRLGRFGGLMPISYDPHQDRKTSLDIQFEPTSQKSHTGCHTGKAAIRIFVDK